jgi:acyl carrier protein
MGIFDKIKHFVGGGDGSDESRRAEAQPSASEPSVSAARVDSGAAEPLDSTGLLDRFKEKVAELSTGQLTPDTIDPRASLFDFGYLDSLTAVTMIAHIESEYGVSVSEIDLVEELDHLQALVDRVARDRTR